MNKEEFLKIVSKLESTGEDEFKADYNSPELIWDKLIKQLREENEMLKNGLDAPEIWGRMEEQVKLIKQLKAELEALKANYKNNAISFGKWITTCGYSIEDGLWYKEELPVIDVNNGLSTEQLYNLFKQNHERENTK